ncbi:MAG TPA: hypothetical protein PLA49_14885 [Propioniciclava sp.]|uniref:hypothetical protein n=2 Tax=Propioniciclava sp. TaxID=2038686 RepID=UPI002CE125CF|nr:hypothetical protein [Propioniciclava sp.]HRL50643.1 hypothetical protein [Propioniciclava sp.]
MSGAARAGEVYAFPLTGADAWGALQVLTVDEANADLIVAVLDWIGPHEPTLEQVRGAGPLMQDFMFWGAHPMVQHVPVPVPGAYRLLGVLPADGMPASSSSWGHWAFDRQVARQAWWDALPHELTAAFKAALDSPDTVALTGLIEENTGEPLSLRVSRARRFTDDAQYRIGPDFTMASLRAWPALHQVHLSSWRDDLIGFLEDSPLVGDLTLHGHGQPHLDLSRTHLTDLSVDVGTLETLTLPDGLTSLALLGTPPGILRVRAKEQGREVSLRLVCEVIPVTGLERLAGLQISDIAELSVRDVAARHPRVRSLDLFGAPGLLRDVAALPDLRDLDALRMVDLFGFDATAFPGPGAWERLRDLDLDSLPAAVATAVRRAYKASPLTVSVRRPRKPEWLAENLENPLRHWDGRPGIPASVAKKTRLAFVAALRAVRTADADLSPGEAYDAAVSDAVRGFLAVIAAANRRHGFLYTLERDEVIVAVDALIPHLSEDAHRALEPTIEEALDG